MDDSEIVAAIATGDPAGLPAAYDNYAAGVYGYCHWMLREPRCAATAFVETFVAAAAELGRLKYPNSARAFLYATARNECQVRLGKAARDAAPIGAASPGFRPLKQEASELSVRHGLSDAELAAVLDLSWQEAHNLAAHGREHLVPPSMALLGPISPELREHVLRRAAVSAARSYGDKGASRARTAGWQRLGKLLAWPGVRANPGTATAIAAIAAWVVAAVGAVFITITGMHPAHAVATHTHSGTATATSRAVGHRSSRSGRASPSLSFSPVTSPSHADAVPPTSSEAGKPPARGYLPGVLAPAVGLEPTTYRLTAGRSAN
jgi:DNA-directed RNA polymerase specialized sigma24 family protein